MGNPAELVLVETAIKSGVTGCFEWDDDAAQRVRRQRALDGLTPEYVRRRARECVLDGSAKVKQVKETRPEWCHREYYYKIVFPEPGFMFGVFVEMELTDDDEKTPCVTIFNSHEQRK